MDTEDVSDVDVLSQCRGGKRVLSYRSVVYQLKKNDKASISHWMESPTHHKQSTCISYDFALVQGVN